jgi:glycosyltransferase involved in cell wall biosynthesis
VTARGGRLSVFAFHDGHACGYYRLLLPLREMEAAGHHVDANHGFHERCEDHRIIVGQRIGKPEALPVWRRLAARHKLVYETDDDLFAIDSWNVAAKLAHTDEVIDAAIFAASIADMVTVSTEPLAEVMRRYNDNVVVLPNHIDGALLDIQRPRRDRVTVGWAGGDSHLRDFQMVAPSLRRFLERNPAVDFHNVGSNYLRPMKLRGRHTAWSADIFDYYRGIDFDVGIAPLADIPFNRSKSHIKALEYAALGIPVVASDAEPYRDFVVDGVTGWLVRHEHEWGKRLYELANDAAMREQMGAAAKERARGWVIQDGWKRWADAYRTLM